MEITYFKRMRAILKKCIEISEKCELDVFCFIRDRKMSRIVEFNSTPGFNLGAVSKIKK